LQFFFVPGEHIKEFRILSLPPTSKLSLFFLNSTSAKFLFFVSKKTYPLLIQTKPCRWPFFETQSKNAKIALKKALSWDEKLNSGSITGVCREFARNTTGIHSESWRNGWVYRELGSGCKPTLFHWRLQAGNLVFPSMRRKFLEGIGEHFSCHTINIRRFHA